MTISVASTVLIENPEVYSPSRYVVIGTSMHEYDGLRYERTILADRKTTCLHELRSGYCTMDKGHKGRHSTVTFGCDGCGKTRRGQPYRSNEEVAMCFMCCLESDRYYGGPLA